MEPEGSAPTSVPNAPVRRMDKNDMAIVKAVEWHALNRTDFLLEDKVSLADSKAVFLQGLVVYVGRVHFAEGIHVGVQLTGPSIGRGYCDGTYKGKKYFASVGKNNGVIAHVSKVSKRLPVNTGNQEADAKRVERRKERSLLADLEFIDCLVECRSLAILKMDEERKTKFARFRKEENHVQRLKQLRHEELMRSRGMDIPDHEEARPLSKNRYAGPAAILAPHDLELAEGLESTQQNYCLSDPSLPDNPIVYASQEFLNMTGYNLNEILGRNCRFLQGPGTDKYHVYRVRKTIQEGSDCHVCLLNYRKDGTTFYNRLFMTALRDTKGRIKNYLGVQTEVSPEMAMRINATEKLRFEQGVKNARLESSDSASETGSTTHIEHDSVSISISSGTSSQCEYSFAKKDTGDSSNGTSISGLSDYVSPLPLRVGGSREQDFQADSVASDDTPITDNLNIQYYDIMDQLNRFESSRQSTSVGGNRDCSRSEDTQGADFEVIGIARRQQGATPAPSKATDIPARHGSTNSLVSFASESTPYDESQTMEKLNAMDRDLVSDSNNLRRDVAPIDPPSSAEIESALQIYSNSNHTQRYHDARGNVRHPYNSDQYSAALDNESEMAFVSYLNEFEGVYGASSDRVQEVARRSSNHFHQHGELLHVSTVNNGTMSSQDGLELEVRYHLEGQTQSLDPPVRRRNSHGFSRYRQHSDIAYGHAGPLVTPEQAYRQKPPRVHADRQYGQPASEEKTDPFLDAPARAFSDNLHVMRSQSMA